MPVNPYDDHNVSLRRPHGTCDVDIVRASYTRRKANVTEALLMFQRCRIGLCYFSFKQVNNGSITAV